MNRFSLSAVFAPLAAAAVLMCAPLHAQAATLVGRTVDFAYTDTASFLPLVSMSPSQVTVQDGTADASTASFLGFVPLFTVNVDAASVTVSFLRTLSYSTASFTGVSISGLGSAVSGVTQTSGPAVASSFSAGTLYLNFAGSTYARNSVVKLAVAFAAPPVSAVPVPGGLPLAATGLAALAVLRRRARQG